MRTPSKNSKVNRNNISKNNIDQKVHQEIGLKKDEILFEDKLDRLKNETQDYMYKQSSKFSMVSRNLIFGIMGTIWAFTFSDGSIITNNILLMIALFSCLIYLLLDVIHYYTDSNSYNDEQYNLDNITDDEGLKLHERNMDRINQRSSSFIKCKFTVLIISSLIFLVGLIFHLSLPCS